MNKRQSHKAFHDAKTPPALNISSQQRIYAFLRDRVKGQDTSLNGLAAIISRLLVPHTERKVYRATLGGASGSGKTTTVESIRSLLGMDDGYMYAGQFISINGGAVSDNKERHGGKEGSTLMKRLKNAIETTKSPETGKKESLPYICLFIEDIDKASSKFMDSLGPLFESGTYRLANNESFSIPKKTPLLVLFTTNCASSDIASMKTLDDSVAAEMIRITLKKRWPDDGNLMKRIETIFPFYVLTKETLRPILMAKCDEYVKDSDINARFGKDSIHCDEEGKGMIVDHILAKVNTAHGVHGSISQLIRKLDILFSTGLGNIETILSESNGRGEHHSQQLLSPIVVTAHSIDTYRFTDSLDQQLANVKHRKENTLSIDQLIDSILNNPENRQMMDQCDPSQEGTVDAVAMAYGDISLCSLVMNITYNNIQVVNHIDQTEEVQHLKKKLRRYKTSLKEVIHTIDRNSSDSSFNSTMKKMADSKRELIESSGSSDDELPYARPPRMIKKRSLTSSELIPLSKKPRIDDPEILLDYSDEINLYCSSSNNDDSDDDDSIFIDYDDSSYTEYDAISNFEIDEEEEEVRHQGVSFIEPIRQCERCGNTKSLEAFTKRRKDKRTGETRASVSSMCNTCRK